jgi:hypothetical protein
MSKPFFMAKAKSKPSRTAEALDVAARYLVYKLYDGMKGQPAGTWQVLGKMIGENKETVARAVELGWVIVRDEAVGKVKVRSGMLTDEGRRVARRALAK